jgi:plasmid stabilization system protein ParE
MAYVKQTLESREDLEGIWFYIAQDNPSAADSFIETVQRKLSLLAT